MGESAAWGGARGRAHVGSTPYRTSRVSFKLHQAHVGRKWVAEGTVCAHGTGTARVHDVPRECIPRAAAAAAGRLATPTPRLRPGQAPRHMFPFSPVSHMQGQGTRTCVLHLTDAQNRTMLTLYVRPLLLPRCRSCGWCLRACPRCPPSARCTPDGACATWTRCWRRRACLCRRRRSRAAAVQ